MADMTSLMQTRSSLPTQNTPRVNVVSGLAFLLPLAIGAAATALTFQVPFVIVGLLLAIAVWHLPPLAVLAGTAAAAVAMLVATKFWA